MTITALRSTLGFSLRLSAFVAVPAAVGLLLAGRAHRPAALPARRVRRGRRRADRPGPRRLRGRPARVLGHPHRRPDLLRARRHADAGVSSGSLSVAANVVLALVLMWPLAHVGLALASSLSSYVNLLGLYWLLRRRVGGPRGSESAGRWAGRSCATAALAGAGAPWVARGSCAVPGLVVPGSARMLLALRGRRSAVVRGDGGGDPRARSCATLLGMLHARRR